MPIRPQHRWLYPIDWPELSKAIRFKRAKGRRGVCARPHGREVRHLDDGRWWDDKAQIWRNGRGPAVPHFVLDDNVVVRLTKVVLATAHLDHDPSINPARNLNLSANAATCSMTARSISAAAGSPSACARRSGICF